MAAVLNECKFSFWQVSHWGGGVSTRWITTVTKQRTCRRPCRCCDIGAEWPTAARCRPAAVVCCVVSSHVGHTEKEDLRNVYRLKGRPVPLRRRRTAKTFESYRKWRLSLVSFAKSFLALMLPFIGCGPTISRWTTNPLATQSMISIFSINQPRSFFKVSVSPVWVVIGLHIICTNEQTHWNHSCWKE